VRREQVFDLEVNGGAVRRGPIFRYLTLFRGPGDLVLENGMDVTEVLRDGEREPFRAVTEDGFLRLTIGSRDHLLKHRTHRYTIRTVAEGDWEHRDGLTSGTFDVLGPLAGYAIDSARVRLRLPDGVRMERYTPAIRDSRGHSIDVEVSETSTELVFEAGDALPPKSGFFVNAAWPSAGFATRSHWGLILRQHPKLPLTAFSAALLFAALLLLVFRVATAAGRRRSVSAAAA